MTETRFQALFQYSSSNFFFQGSRFITQLFLARILGPTQFGIWITIQLILNYALSSHMGSLDAINRGIPIHLSAGHHEAALTDARIGMGSAITLSTLAAVLFLITASIFYPISDIHAYYPLMAAVIVVQQVHIQYHMTLVAFQKFKVVSTGQILLGSMQLILLPLFSWKMGLNGLIIGYFLSFTCTLPALIHFSGKVILPDFRLRESTKMIRIGFPIMLSGLSFGLMSTIDRLFIIRYYGAQMLGYYSLSIIVSGALMILPIVVAQVYYPRMCQAFGKQKDFESAFVPVWHSTSLLLVVMPVFIIACALIMPLIVNHILSQYVPGIPAMYISLAGVTFLSFAVPFTNYLNTTGAHYAHLVIQAVAIVMGAGLNWISVRLGMSLEGIAVATAGGYLFFLGSMVFVSLYLRTRGEGSHLIRKMSESQKFPRL